MCTDSMQQHADYLGIKLFTKLTNLKSMIDQEHAIFLFKLSDKKNKFYGHTHKIEVRNYFRISFFVNFITFVVQKQHSNSVGISESICLSFLC